MNVFLVRTRLQAIVARKIIRTHLIGEPYIAVFLYRSKIKEELSDVQSWYRELEESASFSAHVSYLSFFSSTLKLLILFLGALLSGGRVLMAGINFYPAAVAIKLLPRLQLFTFDDGSANVYAGSVYFSQSPLDGSGPKRRLASSLFPQGCAAWLRKRTRCHYTIFPGLPNIVEPSKLVVLDWDWHSLLVREDLDTLTAVKSPLIVALGSPDESQERLSNLLDRSDIYILHPREKNWTLSPKAMRFKSPAEAVLLHLASLVEVEVFHFNSTVSYSLYGTGNVLFHNLTPIPAQPTNVDPVVTSGGPL